MHRTRWAPLLMLIVLSGCAIPPPPQRPIPPPGIPGTGSTAPAGDSVDVEAPATKAQDIVPVASTGSGLPERLLPHGILEIGDAAAPLTLLVVTEHRCRYCREFAETLFPVLAETFIASGTLNVHIAVLPLRKYPGSDTARLAMLCAARQGKGLAYHMTLFGRTAMDRSALLAYAQDIGADDVALGHCLDDPAVKTLTDTQDAWLQSLHVTLVPTLFLNGEKSVGLPYEADLLGWIRHAQEQR